MNKKRNDIIEFFIWVLILLGLNFAVGQFFFRIDLTEDKRYTISDATKKLLTNLNQKINIEVYLEGDFPAGFERLQKAIKETLEEFKRYAGSNLDYRFIDPGADPDPKQRNKIYNQLAQRGLQPTNLTVAQGNEQIEKIIFPGAIVIAKDKEAPTTLLKGNQAATASQRLNQSVEGVEYELANAIKLATEPFMKKVGIIMGYNHADTNRLYDLASYLRSYYQVELVNLKSIIALHDYHAIIYPNPDSTLSETDKFKIDQYVVNGGRALIFLDGVKANLDSIGEQGTLALANNTGLEEILFAFGCRVNYDLIGDLNCGVIPMVVGYVGDKPKTSLVPWRYFPVINAFGKHPTVRNMDAVYTKFVSTIDTVLTPSIRKTPLLLTSKYSRIYAAPVRLHFNEARLKPLPQQYGKSYLPVAYLLEGKFTSAYKNRLLPEAEARLQFNAEYKPGKVLVVSDGDFIFNDVSKTSKSVFPLGYDRFTRVTFANKDFVTNVLAYMLDEKGVILAKNKTIQLRPLDKMRIAKERLKWQIINLATPIALVLFFLMIRWGLRKRKYTK
jgi:gliding-associated putative ABC transporter substrate-binding component GldG